MSGGYNVPASKYNTLRGRPKLLPQSNSATNISTSTTTQNTDARQTEIERTVRKNAEGGTERTRKEVKTQIGAHHQSFLSVAMGLDYSALLGFPFGSI